MINSVNIGDKVCVLVNGWLDEAIVVEKPKKFLFIEGFFVVSVPVFHEGKFSHMGAERIMRRNIFEFNEKFLANKIPNEKKR